MSSPTDTEAAALTAVRKADAAVEAATAEAQEAQRKAGDARALAIARLVDAAGRARAAELLGVTLHAIDKATSRARALRQAGEGTR